MHNEYILEAPLVVLSLRVSSKHTVTPETGKVKIRFVTKMFFIHSEVVYYEIIDLKPRQKRPHGGAVSAPDFGSRGHGFESRWRRDSSLT